MQFDLAAQIGHFAAATEREAGKSDRSWFLDLADRKDPKDRFESNGDLFS